MGKDWCKGFTIIELVLTLIVASILIAIAVSSFRNTTRSNHLFVHVNSFVSAMQFARSEAIKRSTPVTLRRGRFVDSSGNFVDSGGSWQGQWEDGWEIFIDPEPTNGEKDGNAPLRVGGPLPKTFTLRSNSIIANRISYRANGRSSNGSVVLCDDRDGNGVPESGTARMIVLLNTGRVRIAEDNSNGIPISSSGTEIDSCIPPFTPPS